MDLRALMTRRPDWIYPVDKELQKTFHYEEIA
jgi:hypothetical protein